MIKGDESGKDRILEGVDGKVSDYEETRLFFVVCAVYYYFLFQLHTAYHISSSIIEGNQSLAADGRAQKLKKERAFLHKMFLS